MAKFKVGDKVTYWAFDKKAKGDVKAVRGERVDIDDGLGGVVTFKAKDLEVWNTKACNSSNPVVRKAMNANACDVATNENLPYMVVIDFPTRREVLSPLFSSEWAATSYAKRMAGKINEKVRVIHKPDGNIVWENACVATNFNYKNKYQWFVVTPSMSGACILAGNKYREDAQEVFKEIKDEEGIPCKVVARRTLERAGIDPNAAESWAKGIRKTTANACGTVKNATMGEIIAQLNGAKIKEAYKLGRSAAETLARCADVLADSGLARAWPEFARDFGDVRGKLTHWLATVEGEFRSLIR